MFTLMLLTSLKVVVVLLGSLVRLGGTSLVWRPVLATYRFNYVGELPCHIYIQYIMFILYHYNYITYSYLLYTYTLTNKTREIRRVSWETKVFQTKPRVWELWPIFLGGTIQPRSFVSKHHQPQTTLIPKTQQKPTKTGCCFEAFNPRLISRVITGKSRVHHGFVTGLEKHGGFPKPRVSGSKPRVSVAKSWVVTGKSRVNPGFGVCINSDLVFSCQNRQNYQKRCNKSWKF